jgi:HPt (histidine-containing phosphotransfer) domain-containing protein
MKRSMPNRNICAGRRDEQFLRELVAPLLVDAQRHLMELREILTTGDMAALARGAQAMNGPAASIGVQVTPATALQLEQQGQSGTLC